MKEVTPALLQAALASIVGGDVDHSAFQKRFGIRAAWQAKPSQFKSLNGRPLAQALAFCVVSSAAAYGDVDDVLRCFGVDLKKIEAEVIAERRAPSRSSPPHPRNQ